MSNNARTWLEIHALLSVFFLPIALLYAVTGGLYTAGIRPEESRPPMATPSVQPATNSNGGAGAEIGKRTEEGAQGGKVTRHSESEGLYGKLMTLHKGKGGAVFNVVGVLFAASLVFMYLSGIVVYWGAPSRHRRLLVTALLGIVFAVVVVALSV